MKKIVNAWFPAFIWMGFIFALSSRKSIGVTDTLLFDFLIFKTLHIIEYAVLYLLIFRGFYLLNSKKINNQYLIYAFLLSLIYAMTDELHQTFVPTREGRLRDVFIDMIGITGMLFLIKAKFTK